jgi:ABC-2 type transport system permease protein
LGRFAALPAVPAPPSPAVWFFRLLWAFARRELAEVARYRVAYILRFVSLGFAILSLYFFSRFIGAAQNQHLARYGGDYLAFGVVGLLITELQFVGVSALAMRVRMAQVMGYLEAQMATPAPAWMVLGVAPFYEFGAALLRSTAYLVGASLLLGVRFDAANAAAVLATVPLVLLAFGGLGLLAAGMTMIARRTNPVAAILGAASMFLSGVVYPVSVLPEWLQKVSAFLPLTHALEALRQALILGRPVVAPELAPSLFALTGFACVLTPLGLGLFVYALRRARIDGSLTHY